MTNPADQNSFQNGQVPVAGQQVNTASNLNQNNIAKSFILLDSGVQHTYITKELNLAPFKQEKITVKVFGSTESKVQNIGVVKFIVIGARKNVYVEALIVPTICSNLIVTVQFQTVIFIWKISNFLKNQCNITIEDIIKGKPSEPIALESTLEWIISGPYSFTNSTNVCNNNSHFLFVPPTNCRYVFENETDHKLSTIRIYRIYRS